MEKAKLKRHFRIVIANTLFPFSPLSLFSSYYTLLDFIG